MAGVTQPVCEGRTAGPRCPRMEAGPFLPVLAPASFLYGEFWSPGVQWLAVSLPSVPLDIGLECCKGPRATASGSGPVGRLMLKPPFALYENCAVAFGHLLGLHTPDRGPHAVDWL